MHARQSFNGREEEEEDALCLMMPVSLAKFFCVIIIFFPLKILVLQFQETQDAPLFFVCLFRHSSVKDEDKI